MKTKTTSLNRRTAVALSLLLGLLAGSCQLVQPVSQVPEPDYWPTDSWQSAPPETQGIDSEKLAELLLAIREENIPVHSLLLIRKGYVVVDATFYRETAHEVGAQFVGRLQQP